MIEHKFRVWDDYKKKMIYGPTDDNVSSSWVYSMYCAMTALNQDRLILMKNTGLFDMNNNDIFENDIVKNIDGGIITIKPEIEILTEYGHGHCSFQCGIMIISGYGKVEDIRDSTIIKGLKIMGNIFENKELLKKKE